MTLPLLSVRYQLTIWCISLSDAFFGFRQVHISEWVTSKVCGSFPESTHHLEPGLTGLAPFNKPSFGLKFMYLLWNSLKKDEWLILDNFVFMFLKQKDGCCWRMMDELFPLFLWTLVMSRAQTLWRAGLNRKKGTKYTQTVCALAPKWALQDFGSNKGTFRVFQYQREVNVCFGCQVDTLGLNLPRGHFCPIFPIFPINHSNICLSCQGGFVCFGSLKGTLWDLASTFGRI